MVGASEQKTVIVPDDRNLWNCSKKGWIMIKLTTEQHKLYFKIGEVVVCLSNLEHRLSCLLEVLTDATGNPWIKPYFIDRIMAGTMVNKIKAIAKVKLRDDQPLWEKLKNLINDIRALQLERNRVVHGKWLFDESRPTKVRNYEVRWEDGCWQYLDDAVMTPKTLDDMVTKSNELENELQEVIAKIEGNT